MESEPMLTPKENPLYRTVYMNLELYSEWGHFAWAILGILRLFVSCALTLISLSEVDFVTRKQ